LEPPWRHGSNLISSSSETKATPLAAKVVALLLAATFLALPVIVYLKWPKPAEAPASSQTPQQDMESEESE